MGIVPALALIAIALLAYKSGALANFGIPAPINTSTNTAPGGLQSNVSLTAPPSIQPGGDFNAFSRGGGSTAPSTGANLPGLAISGAASVGTAAASAPSSLAALGVTGAAAGAALAGIGVVAAIGAALWAAHEQRKAQATDENSAMNLGVQGYDVGVKQIWQAYVTRQISATDAITLLQQVMANYWAEVTPHIQPGRNGCMGGASCPPWPSSGNGCSGNIGAACCVGCYDLIGSSEIGPVFPGQSGPMYFGILGTIAVLQQGGGTVYYQEVYSSKYGGKQRNPYTLPWVQSSVA